MRHKLIVTAASIALMATPAFAQSGSDTRDRLGQFLGEVLGVGDTTMDNQWRLGRTPLASQQAQFETRVDGDVTADRITETTGTRLKTDYGALVEREAGYAADRRFTTAERTDLTERYNALLKVLSDGRYADSPVAPAAEVRDGQAAFDARVDAQLAARKIRRSTATQLKADYGKLIVVETDYLQDGALSAKERRDLDNRLDALDARVGDVGYTVPATPKTRLDAIASALPNSGLSSSARDQLLVEHGDLLRLEAAYARSAPSSEDTAYLEARIANLESRAGIKR